MWGRQMLLMVFTVLGRPSFLGTTQNPQALFLGAHEVRGRVEAENRGGFASCLPLKEMLGAWMP